MKNKKPKEEVKSGVNIIKLIILFLAGMTVLITYLLAKSEISP